MMRRLLRVFLFLGSIATVALYLSSWVNVWLSKYMFVHVSVFVFMCRHVYVYKYDCFMSVHMCTYRVCMYVVTMNSAVRIPIASNWAI